MGIWRPVFLASAKSVKMRSPLVATTFPSFADLSHADLAIAVELTNMVRGSEITGL